MFVFVDVPTLPASLLSSTDPASVRIVLDGSLTAGTAFTLVGTSVSGSSWPVPGGEGLATGQQMVFIDNRAPLNTPITYVLTASGVTYRSEPVTVAYPGRYLIQSLDGRTVVEFVWRSNGLPRSTVGNSVVFDVPGRDRPPVRFATGGDGGGTLEIRTTQENSARLLALLKSGRPLVVRTDGAVRDFPAVELILPAPGGVASRLWDVIAPGGKTMGTDRMWSIDYLLVDDPEPSVAVSAYTWDDFNAAMAGKTWDIGFNDLFAASTWDEFNLTEWDQHVEGAA